MTEYLAASDPDPRHVLRIVPARDGGTYIRNDKGCWRLYNFIEKSLCLEKVGTAQDFETSAFAFGGEGVQRALLEAEGVEFLPDGRVDMAACRWL